MNQAQGQRRKNRVRAVALALFFGSSAVGVGYTMTVAGEFTFGLPAYCVVVQAAIVSWIFYAAMNFMFLNEQGYELEEGTYSDISWLNANQNTADESSIVLLEQDSLATIVFEAAQCESMVNQYRADSSCNSILESESEFKISRVNWSNVTAVLSRSNDATIDIESSYGVTRLFIINVDTKEHALKYIKARLPASAFALQKEESNAVSVIVLIGGLLTLIAGALMVGSMVFTTIAGGLASLFFPTFLKALYKPDIETVMRVSNAYGHDYESNIPPSTSSVVPVTKSF